jgi:formiminotetrahydrofolate cyclodeaminase
VGEQGMTEQAELIAARVRNASKRAEIHQMLETATDQQKAAVDRIVATFSMPSGTDLERLEAVYGNLLQRERALKSSSE